MPNVAWTRQPLAPKMSGFHRVTFASLYMTQFAKETLPISLEEEMRRSYLDYAMSVIVGRALPDAVSYTHLTLPTKA